MRRTPPLGLLGSQVYSMGGPTSWDDAEMVIGLVYALEAAGLSR